MFWGLELEPAKKYKQTVEKSFHISMACLQPSKSPDNDYVSFVLTKDNQDFILCNLQKDKSIQVQLDLNFSAGDEITFQTKGGKNKIHLSGYLIDDEIEDQSGWMESDSGEEDEEDIPQLVSVPQKINIKRKNGLQPLNVASKVAKVEIDEVDTSDEEVDNEEDDEEGGEEEEDDGVDDGSESDDESSEEEAPAKQQTPVKTPQIQKSKTKTPQHNLPSTPTAQTNGKSPQDKKNKKGQETPTPSTPKVAKTPGTPATGTPKKVTLPGGVNIQDTKIGLGPVAKSGKMATVYYVGRLKSNNKMFDSSTSGKGFAFRLGQGEVIKGWDIGIAGMKVGGKRTISIPPALAYGSKGSPPVIPPNATLSFEVELKGVS